MSAVLVVVLTGCSVAVTGMASPAPVPAGQQPGSTQAVPVGVDPAEIADDVRNAEQIVNTYWEKHWVEFFPGSTYQPPRVVGLYDGSKPSPDLPTCGGEPLPPDNALYCPEGDFVAWDVALMARGVVIGDGWVYLIIAHEWGHAVQARISEAQNSQQSELQADCFAGAVLYGAANDGLLTLEEGDVREIANSLTEAADETPWTTSRDHGDPFQRIGAFDIGRRGGVAGCLPMAG
ncbi:neutral zinc metallopeptidase [Actinomycetes bacterium KLBMP 9759]